MMGKSNAFSKVVAIANAVGGLGNYDEMFAKNEVNKRNPNSNFARRIILSWKYGR